MSSVRKPRPVVKLVLYVAGGTQNSRLAMANLEAICHDYLPGRHVVEVVDVFKEPERALADQVFMTPALVRVAPSPTCRIVGTLSHVGTVLTALGLPPLPA